ncbi:MAG: hypothetical protein IKA36_05600 [Clostridia bacterium]|nr:hypothetical protein [Clostridia bacterium]
MKKKVGLISRISLMIALLCTAIGFSFLGNYKKVQPQKTQAVGIWKDGVGLLDSGNIVLSVSKVAVRKDGASNPLDDNSKHAYTHLGEKNGYTDKVQYNYFYRDIPDLKNNQNKTLVQNGQFVKLNNDAEGKATTHYYNFVSVGELESFVVGTTYYKIAKVDDVLSMIEKKETETTPVKGVTYYTKLDVKVEYEEAGDIDASNFDTKKSDLHRIEDGEYVSCRADSYNDKERYYRQISETAAEMQEAILITFGQEKYDENKDVVKPSTQLSVKIEHNGKELTDIPSVRSNGFQRDFGYVITQSDDSEGYYKITIPKGYIFPSTGVDAKEDIVFEFYIINNTTYTGSYEENLHSYKAEPELRLADGVRLPVESGVNVYNQGSTSKNFPVLTYDYTLYKMTYTHTLDGVTNEYQYNYLPKSNQIQIIKTYRNIPTELEPINLNKGYDSNKLVILFSELGSYQFDFQYIYSGYIPSGNEDYKVIDDINDSIPTIKLDIRGFEVNYSKKGYFDGAEMRYFTFSNADQVYFKVVDGYPRISNPNGVDSLGIVYSSDNTSSLRTGSVTVSQDTNVISKLEGETDYTNLYTGILEVGPNAGEVLKRITYETTDQNPVKLKTNVDFLPFNEAKKGIVNSNNIEENQGSFYVYSSEKINSTSVFNYEKFNITEADFLTGQYYEKVNGEYKKTNSIPSNTFDENKTYYKLDVTGELDLTQYDEVLKKDDSEFGSYFIEKNGTYIKASTLGNYNENATYYTMDNDYVAKYTSDTSFNNVGYYLVFLAVKNGKNFSHYQVIAFNNILQDVEMKTIECDSFGEMIDNAVSYPEFTRNQVKLTWKEPDIFEMGLTIGYYYKPYGNTFTGIYDELDLRNTAFTTVKTIGDTVNENGEPVKWCKIGTETLDNQSGKYLIVIRNEKGNEWTTSFTIDKQPISGIAGKGVTKNEGNYQLSSEFIADFISNTIKNKYGATLTWNDKPSGASITAKYQTISFVSSAEEIRKIANGKINTNYQTNNELDGSYGINKPINNTVKEDDVLDTQGIYIFDLIDQAGNTAKYMLILDDTLTFFAVTETDKSNSPRSETVYKTAEWLQYNDVKLNIEAPKYKLIKINESKQYIVDLIEDTLEEIDNENLNKLFAYDGYIQVEQTQIYEIDTNKQMMNNITSIPDSGKGLNLNILNTDENGLRTVEDGSKIVQDDGTSIIRTYYVRGANQDYLNMNDEITASKSYIKVEINPDNSKGYVFFSKDQMSVYPTGSEYENKRLTTTMSLNSAHATNENFVLFTWIMDMGGEYEVGEVSLDYYPLNLSSFTGIVEDKNYYFFDKANKETIKIYSFTDGIGLADTQIVKESIDGKDVDRGFVTLNIQNNMSRPGYYVVSRTYKNVAVVAGTNDLETMNYHFIVDRNGVISMVDGKQVGQYIHLGLLEDETLFNSFQNISTTNFDSINIDDGNLTRTIEYRSSLDTNKLPAVAYIPIGKYNDATGNYSDYYSGKLDFSMYYKDTNNQLNGGEGATYPLLKVSVDTDISRAEIKNNIIYYPINIRDYIRDKSAWDIEGLRQFFIYNEIESDWLCLPGDYIIVIDDRIDGITDKYENTQVVAFTIRPQQEPETPVFVTPNDKYHSNVIADKEVVSSQQYIKVEFPVYDDDNTNAQIYSVTYNGKTYYKEDLDVFTYNDKEMVSLTVDAMPNVNDLYDGQGTYSFVVRYKLGNNNKYRYCYSAYGADGKIQDYYETLYTVEIDRKAPEKNINELISNDYLAKTYYGNDKMFEQSYYDYREQKSTTYFVNRSRDYYSDQQLKNIYTFAVNKNTTLNIDNDDVVELRYRKFDPSKKINLPANSVLYTIADGIPTNYGFLSDTPDVADYYEILEIDEAGNVSQYIVSYSENAINYSMFDIEFMAPGSISIKMAEDGNGVWKTQIDDSTQKTIMQAPVEEGFVNAGDDIYVMEIYKGGILRLTEKTNIKTQDLHKVLATTLSEQGYGNYIVKIHSRNNEDTEGVAIDYVESSIDFTVANMVEITSEGCDLNLSGANKTTIDGVNYYIKEIKFKKIEELNYQEYSYYNGYYKNYLGEPVPGNKVHLTEEGNYILLAKTMFDNWIAYPFSTNGERTESVIGIYDDSVSGNYYSFQPIKVKYAEGLYTIREIKYSIDGASEISINSATYYDAENQKPLLELKSMNGYAELRFSPYYPEKIYDADGKFLRMEEGKLVKITVLLKGIYEGEEVGANYTIYLDSRTGVVSLTNTKNGIDQEIDRYNNQDNKSQWVNTTMTSGTMNLSWLRNPSENYTLKYLLHEKVDDDKIGWIDPIDLTEDEDRIYIIETKENHKGLYAFEVQVYSKNGQKLLGNIVYAFMVKKDSLNLYTVQSKENSREYTPNSTITLVELDEWLSDINDKLKKEPTEDIKIPSEIPLYIANEELRVVEDSGQGVRQLSYKIDIGDSVLEIYRVFNSSYSQYLATLVVPKTNNLILKDSLKLNNNAYENKPVLPSSNKSSIELTMTQDNGLVHNIVKKNLLRLEIYFNEEKVADHFATSKDLYYEIKGAGLYTFKVYDLAGNCQLFEKDADSFDVFSMANNEIALLMNGNRIIENAYFSGAVQVAVVKDDMYDSISLSATRNGSPSDYSKNKQIYTFTKPGTYRINIKATYVYFEGINRRTKDLTKTLIFTIVDPEETTTSINLGLLDKYQLIQVMNYNEDVTDIFKEVLANSSKGNLVTYEALKEKMDAGVFYGKQRFALTYKVSDGIYSDIEQTFEFSLSNEVPAIKCSLKPGESSKKSFTITYNPGLIYEQIGKARIYINGKYITIDKNSPIEIKTETITQKRDGSGDYTIRLVSGENVLFSQTVKLKTPLNASSIIIIVVVSAIVITGVVVFILLRRKMRIR